MADARLRLARACQEIEQARRRYLPVDRIGILFIAEAPPADPSRFFYFEQVDHYDWLYLALMRVLYPDARKLEARELRQQKADYLERFRTGGHYLVDARDGPMPKGAASAVKRKNCCRHLSMI